MPFEDFCKELLAKLQGLSVAEVLIKGREYEAIQAFQASLKSMSATATNNDAVSSAKTCGNCGLHHAQCACLPSLQFCLWQHCTKGHWKKKCHTIKGGTQPPPEQADPPEETQ